MTEHLPQLIGHRGEMRHYPENTLAAFQAALAAGARCIEFDVQLARDLVPMVIHDATLARTSGESASVLATEAATLGRLRADRERELTGGHGAYIPRLSEVVGQFNEIPSVTAFVELKGESLGHFGVKRVVERVVRTMKSARFEWVLISFWEDALRFARRRYGAAIGWVLAEHSVSVRRAAQALAPQYVFCDVADLSATAPFWPGPWRWAVYDIEDPARALALHAQGADMIETGCIADMLASAPFDRRGAG